MRLTLHEPEAQVTPTAVGIPWLGFVVYPDHRRLKRRNVVNFTRRFERNIALYEMGRISFAELDVSVQGWINHVRYAGYVGVARPRLRQSPYRPPTAHYDNSLTLPAPPLH